MKQNLKSNNFIAKFYTILKVYLFKIQNTNFQDIIKLDQAKAKIFIYDKERFQVQILPFYFRHSKFPSFVRQLNLYGFKIIKKQQDFCFTHPVIQQGGQFTNIVAKKKLKNEESSQIRQISAPQSQQSFNSLQYYNQPVLQSQFQNPNYLLMHNILPQNPFSLHSQPKVLFQIHKTAENVPICSLQPDSAVLLMPTFYGYPCQSYNISSLPPKY